MGISLSAIKNEIAKSGTNKGKFLYFKEGEKVRIRFLTDLEEGMEIPFHDSFQLGVNVPCQEVFGRECEYCEMEELRTRKMYFWSVYDYESKEVKILMAAVNNCSPVPALASFYESYGTITDRDYELKKIGKGTNTTFTVVPLEKLKFRVQKVKAMSDEAIKKAIDKAFPADNNEIDEDEEPKKKRPAKQNTKTKQKAKPEPEEEEDDSELPWSDEDEQTNDYESKTPQELYKLCKERDIECKPRKSKEYYIDLLEAQDEEESEDDWDEEESDEDWDE